MANNALSSVKEAALTSFAAWTEFLRAAASLEGPNGELFDVEKPIPNLPVTIKQVEQKLAGVITLAENVAEADRLELIPDALVADVISKSTALKVIVEKFPGAFAALEKDSPIVSLDASAMTATNEKGQQIALVPLLSELYPAVQALLTPLQQLRSMTGASGGRSSTLEMSEINVIKSAQSRAYGQLERLRKALSSSRDAVDKITSSVQDALRETEANKIKSVNAVNKIDEVSAKAAELLTNVNAAIASANTLNQQVLAYQQTFTDFQTKLDVQNQQIAKGQSDWSTMLAEITKTHEEVKRLQERSREVLGEATMSGLSENFAREMKSARWGVMRAQWAFYFSIAFLLLSAGVVLNAFPVLERLGWVHAVVFNPPAGIDYGTLGVLYVGNIISKAIFLAPAVLFLAFTARRYGEVFQLKKLYTYKYTIASSLPGFKVEAPAYAEAITAMAFQKLLVNTDEHSAQEEKNPAGGTTFLSKIIEPAVKEVVDKMVSVPKKPG